MNKSIPQIRLEKAIQRGIKRLVELQEKKGNFLVYSETSYPSPFFTALILLSLHDVDDRFNLTQLSTKAQKYLLTQKSAAWTFNYWERESEQSKKQSYPDDLDDTFCILAALFILSPDIFDGKLMVTLLKILISNEVNEGGPYTTWVVDKKQKEWFDIDIAVNVNIAYFLSLLSISLPSLLHYIEKKIENNELLSKYYVSEIVTIYFLSRFYKGKYIPKLIDYLKKNINKQDILLTALSVSSLLHFDPKTDVSKYIQEIIQKQTNDEWVETGFVIEQSNNKKIYAKSKAFTAAVCIETMCLYYKQQFIFARNYKMHSELVYINKVSKMIQKRFSHFPKALQDDFNTILKRIISNKAIPLLPYYFSRSFRNKNNLLLVKLGAANVYGWIAYTIFDSFLDEESKPKMLSIGTICHRELVTIFNSILPTNKEFHIFFKTIMDEIDLANYKETKEYRYKENYEKVNINNLPDIELTFIAKKSIGYALPAIALLFINGYSKKSLEVKATINFFTHFLTAKQLNDDAHDWKEDIQKGFFTVVTNLIFKEINKNLSLGEIKKKTVLSKMEEIFWNKVILEVCRLIISEISKARSEIKSSSILVNNGYFENVLRQLEETVELTLKEREQILSFYKDYKS